MGLGGAVLGGLVAGLLVSRHLRRRPVGVGRLIGQCESLVTQMQDQLSQLKAAAGS